MTDPSCLEINVREETSIFFRGLIVIRSCMFRFNRVSSFSLDPFFPVSRYFRWSIQSDESFSALVSPSPASEVALFHYE